MILRNFAVKNMTMKKILLMALLLTMFLGMYAQTGKLMVVTYFSWSGSTKNLAEEIQRHPDADIYRIEPLVPYTEIIRSWLTKSLIKKKKRMLVRH